MLVSRRVQLSVACLLSAQSLLAGVRGDLTAPLRTAASRQLASLQRSRTAVNVPTFQMTPNYPHPIYLPSKKKQTSTVLVLHGLGDSGAGWADVASLFSEELESTKFIFPTASLREVTVNLGMRMTAWYNINSLEEINHSEDEAGLLESKRYIEELIEAEEKAGIPANRIVVAGFSQGGAVALLMLRSDKKLAAVVGMSTYMPLSRKPPVVSEANKATPVLMCHGTADPVVLYRYFLQTAEVLKAAGVNLTFTSYQGMSHTALPQELMEVRQFLKTVLK